MAIATTPTRRAGRTTHANGTSPLTLPAAYSPTPNATDAPRAKTTALRAAAVSSSPSLGPSDASTTPTAMTARAARVLTVIGSPARVAIAAAIASLRRGDRRDYADRTRANNDALDQECEHIARSPGEEEPSGGGGRGRPRQEDERQHEHEPDERHAGEGRAGPPLGDWPGMS